MAKRKTATQPPITDDELKKLGDKLIDTGNNVYRLAESMFTKVFQDEDWARLRKLSNIFKCGECGRWKGVGQESELIDICVECQEEIDSEEDDD